MSRACRRVFQRVRWIIAMPLRFLRRYKKSELALCSPSTNNALNVGASQAGTCPVFASQIISFTAMQRYRLEKRACLDVTCKQIALKIFKNCNCRAYSPRLC
jgi:hypothetical protein